MPRSDTYRTNLIQLTHLNAKEIDDLNTPENYTAIREGLKPTPRWLQDLAQRFKRPPAKVFEDASGYRYSFKFQMDKHHQRARPIKVTEEA